MTYAPSDEGAILRVYENARTVHLERLRDFTPGQLCYVRQNYDFDERLAKSASAERVSRKRLFGILLRTEAQVVELNEPTFVAAWGTLGAAHLALWLRRRFGRGSAGPMLVSYAIDNADPVEWFSSRTRLPAFLFRGPVRTAVRMQVRALSRLAFGTEQAQVNYEQIVGGDWPGGVQRRLFTSIAPECMACKRAETRAGRVAYLGTFDSRKGLRELLAAWPLVRASRPDSELVVMGKGNHESEVRRLIGSLEGTTLIVDPPRETIHAELASAQALVLLSRRTRGWREQVGLPILEGLSHGCQIVTTRETGIAEWLADAGHAIVPDLTPETVSTYLTDALAGDPAVRSQQVRMSLPVGDPRIAADEWLTSH